MSPIKREGTEPRTSPPRGVSLALIRSGITSRGQVSLSMEVCLCGALAKAHHDVTDRRQQAANDAAAAACRGCGIALALAMRKAQLRRSDLRAPTSVLAPTPGSPDG